MVETHFLWPNARKGFFGLGRRKNTEEHNPISLGETNKKFETGFAEGTRKCVHTYWPNKEFHKIELHIFRISPDEYQKNPEETGEHIGVLTTFFKHGGRTSNWQMERDFAHNYAKVLENISTKLISLLEKEDARQLPIDWLGIYTSLKEVISQNTGQSRYGATVTGKFGILTEYPLNSHPILKLRDALYKFLYH